MILKNKNKSLPLRFYILFVFYTFLFLFYPGNSYHFDIFAFNRPLFTKSPERKLLIKISPIPILRSPNYPQVSAEGIYVVDLNSFTPLFEKNTHQRFFPASTTKIITALTAYDIYQPDNIITVKNVKNDGQLMGLIPGEKITFENLLYGMLVYSGNDAAYVLANDKDFDSFINLMNKKAQALNMRSSHFSNPAGLDQNSNYSSPFDMALAARELLKNKTLAKIVSTKEITISDVDFKYFHKLTNINKLLGEVAGLGGLKTGYTENAGENLISFYKNNGHQYIIVMMKSADRFADTRNVIDWLKTNIDYINQSDNLR